MRINDIDHFIAVILTLDECYKQPARLVTEHVFQDSTIQVVMQFLLQRVSYITEVTATATRHFRLRDTCMLFDVVISFIGETQYSFLEMLVHFCLSGEQAQAPLLAVIRRYKRKVGIASKHRPGHLS